MNNFQSGILHPVPLQASYLHFTLDVDDIKRVKAVLALIDTSDIVVGLGYSLTEHLGVTISGLKAAADLRANDIHIPSKAVDLWCWLRGDDRGELLHQSRRLCKQLSPVFTLTHPTDGFRYAEGRDLTGYVDGTENPEAQDAVEAAIVNSDDTTLNGSSFVAVQRWQHDLDQFESFDRAHRDDIIGRRREDNEEFEGSPTSAHVKRTAQESFEPEAFMLRRSMPWHEGMASGLMFVAFGQSFYAFEAQLARMLGQEDGITDGLFEFSKVLESSYFWCPPVDNNRLVLAALDA